MKIIIRLVVVFFAIVALSGCMSMRTNTKTPSMEGVSVQELNTNNSISIINPLTDSGDVIIGKWIGWKVYGNYFKFTKAAIGATIQALRKENVILKENGDKSLELSIYDVKSEQGAFLFSVTTSLKVKTGDGLIREYTVDKKHGNGYGTTPTIEKTIALCVGEMLNDKDIVNYLVN